MAIIGQIRSRGKWAMLIFIGLGIFLFLIMSEWQNVTNIFRGSKTKVAVINGKSFDTKEFEQLVTEDETNFELNRGNGYKINEEERMQLREQTWKTLAEKTVMNDLYDKEGITVSTDEMLELTRGSYFPSPQITQAFTDPQTRQFNVQNVINFLQNLDRDEPGTEPGTKRRQWTNFEKSMKETRYTDKFNKLVTKSFYTPTWFNKMLNDDFAKNMDVSVVALPFASVSDTSIKVTDDDRKAYFEKHQKIFEQKEEGRQMRYVTFPVVASRYDTMDHLKWMSDKLEELKKSENDTAFFNTYSETPFDFKFYKKAELQNPFTDSIFNLPKGAFVGPYYDGKQVKIARVSDRKMISDSVQIRQIMFSFEGLKSQAEADKKGMLFDSIFRQLDTMHADFASLANAYSDDPANTDAMTGLKKGGEQGWVKFGEREPEFNRQIFFEDKGHILRIRTQNSIYLVQVTASNPTVQTVQVQNLSRTMMPSKATEDSILAAATTFAANNQNKDKFVAAVEKLGPARGKEVALHKNDYNLMGIGIARQVIKWGFDAKEGEVSTPFRVADKYVVIMVEHIVAKGIPAMDVFKEEITMRIRNEKKGEMLKKKMMDIKATSIGQLATKLNTQVITVPGLTFMTNSVPNFGTEPVIPGTAFKLAKGKMSAPVVGNQGVFVIQVDNITSKPPTPNLEDYGRFIINNISQRFSRGLVQSIVDKSDIEDNRANFY